MRPFLLNLIYSKSNTMSKKIIYLLLILIAASISSVLAQTINYADGKPVQVIQYTELQGSIYFNDNWLPGSVKTEDGKLISNLKLKYDELNDQVYFKGQDESPMAFLTPVQEFTLIGEGGQNLTFRNGYPSIQSLTEKSFYCVLADGKTQFLKKTVKQIVETKEYNSATSVKTALEGVRYLIFKNHALTIVKKDKKSILAALGDKQDQLEAYIKANNLNLKDEGDIIKLVTYYNSI